jgi:hypothetical protein
MKEAMTQPEKLDLRSHDVTGDRIADLLRLFPEIRTEGGKLVTIKLAAAAPGSVLLCSVVVAELLYGAHRSARKTQTLS